MKRFLFILTLIGFTSFIGLSAQDCTFYFPVKSGSSIEMKNYNAKDKLTGSLKSKVIEQSGDKVKFTSEVYDEKGKLLSQGDYEVQCKNGEYAIDMNSFLKGLDMNAYKDMDVKIEASELTLPSKMQAGQQLNDGQVNMKVSKQGVSLMNMTVKVMNRKVESFEDITTPAGTFKCAKISYEVETKMMMTVRSKINEWISEKVGVVRSETYDHKGKLSSYSILTSISN